MDLWLMSYQKRWNWQHPDWPTFSYDLSKVEDLEKTYKANQLISYGIYKHFSEENKEDLKVGRLSEEAYKTSEIEGESLDRESLQSSIKKQFGLKALKCTRAAENGIAEMMTHLYKTFSQPLTSDMLCLWHSMLMNGRRDITIGAYRTHPEPMEIVSGSIYAPTIHYEAPPSGRVFQEMEQFIKWFNEQILTSDCPLSKAAIAHLYFESIHPFEDGNGRIGRALVEKILSCHNKSPVLIALSSVIQRNKKAYYENLHKFSRTLSVTGWLIYFCETLLEAQKRTVVEMEFLIQKGQFLHAHEPIMNERQRKVVKRILREGVEGFKGGLSSENYQSITQVSSSTATRDLNELVEKKILVKTGERKYTRYWLSLMRQEEGLRP